ncbi:MAG: hypothetical protein DHS20C15_19230 [Planctomycetota bacterium]|nr:MAG: hypothetical protein DHS20C15_19230 [Planctomycetota bacterium]
MDFALLCLIHGLLLAALLTRRAPRGGRLRWHRRLLFLFAALLGVLCWNALTLARPPGVPRELGHVALSFDVLGLAGLWVALQALTAAPRAERLRRVGLGLGAASFCAAATWFQIAVRAQSGADPALSETLAALWRGSFAPAALLALVHGLAAALFIAWGIAAPELHAEEPAWRRDNVMTLPCATLLALITALLLI